MTVRLAELQERAKAEEHMENDPKALHGALDAAIIRRQLIRQN